MRKATDLKVTQEFLETRCHDEMQRWVYFCCVMIGHGLDCYLYEARRTRSKYITVQLGEKSYKVRFSDHPPIPEREDNNDCDFFVGRTNRRVTTTDQAILECLWFFKGS